MEIENPRETDQRVRFDKPAVEHYIYMKFQRIHGNEFIERYRNNNFNKLYKVMELTRDLIESRRCQAH